MNPSPSTKPTPLFLQGVCLCVLFIFSFGFLPAATLPKVVLFTTGGTIQSKGEHRDKLFEYTDGKVTPKELTDDLPELQTIAAIETVEISNVGSGEIGAPQLLKLVKAINAALARPDVTGAVVTHGTSTLEETAYFLHLTVKSTKPVVVVGAMRPFTAISRDGPFNLYNSVRVAITPEAVGKGVMVVLDDTIHSARFVTKGNTYHVDTFVDRDIGPLGFTDSDRVVFYRTPLSRHTSNSEFDVSILETLPMVDIVYGYQEASAAPLEALITAGAKGIILNDGAPSFKKGSLKALSEGIVVVQSDRKGSGRVVLSEHSAGRGVITADSLNAQKARVLLRLALTKTTDAKEIQRIFNTY